ncbi:hypothetical protein Y032_0216g2388 [Ancylostoma ceylanicum]|uniref:Uncharacterized protein n=1 Tax=Ancylostoma ceylanicum TaxID=53326 RepID=A0A016SJY8_9BILA|nr:hypothetical protein Y032_0216g2388 [Ancylostoma ceylanicum]
MTLFKGAQPIVYFTNNLCLVYVVNACVHAKNNTVISVHFMENTNHFSQTAEKFKILREAAFKVQDSGCGSKTFQLCRCQCAHSRTSLENGY